MATAKRTTAVKSAAKTTAGKSSAMSKSRGKTRAKSSATNKTTSSTSSASTLDPAQFWLPSDITTDEDVVRDTFGASRLSELKEFAG